MKEKGRIDLDLLGILNEQINDMMIKSSDDSPFVKDLMGLLNKYGMCGFEALAFIVELADLLKSHANNK